MIFTEKVHKKIHAYRGFHPPLRLTPNATTFVKGIQSMTPEQGNARGEQVDTTPEQEILHDPARLREGWTGRVSSCIVQVFFRSSYWEFSRYKNDIFHLGMKFLSNQ
jgi:hypothetical protein